MNNIDREKGQTIIEVALITIFLLVLFFGIAEIARAWWLKNQLNNAARVGVRVAIVDSTIKNLTALPSANCFRSGGGCTTSSGNEAIIEACDSITNENLCDTANVAMELTEDPTSNGVSSGDSITLTVTGDFDSVVPNLASLSLGLFQSQYNMTSKATMRYE